MLVGLGSLLIGGGTSLIPKLNHNVNAATTLQNTKYSKSVSDYRNGTTYNGKNYNLNFNSSKYKLQTIKVNGKNIKVRCYENITYVSQPVSKKYQTMNVYIPDAYFHGEKINGYSSKTAPVFMPNNIGGYMSATAGTLNGGGMSGGTPSNMKGKNNNQKQGPPQSNQKQNNQSSGSSTNATQKALSEGYIVASPGARGRDDKENNKNVGSAPAGIVDLKAAVRYLKYNQNRMPGNYNKIYSDGTSAGGALSALLGASGNNKDYYPYLKAIGAADTSDNIYGSYAFAPITNLDNADSAYEWEFNGINKISGGMPGSSSSSNSLNSKQKQMSSELKKEFVSYVNNLRLKNGKTQLKLSNNKQSTFDAFVKEAVMDSAQTAINNGTKISTNNYPWLTIKNNKVTDVNLSKYFASVGRSKSAPAFDSTDLSTPETQEFGTSTKDAQHFTNYGMKNNTKSGATQTDSQVVKMMNPMNYIGKSGSNGAKHYWIRYGASDSNTSIATPLVLSQKLKNTGIDTNYHLQWDTGHTGDYDIDGMFNWSNQLSK